MIDKIDVLDYGYVRLVDYMGSDSSIVRAARVSYGNDNTTDLERDAKLIRYLLKNKHTSPFEHVTFTFEIKCPIFVARQIMRHRTLSFNEISARYAELPEEYYIPDIDKVGKQSKDNKQMRDISSESLSNIEALINDYIDTCQDSFNIYHSLLENGFPREIARGVLPTATYTRFYATVDLHNLMHFINLRTHPHAQFEVQVYAEAMLSLIQTIVPLTVSIYQEFK